VSTGSRRHEAEHQRRLAAFAQVRAHAGRPPRRTALPRADEPADALITAEELRQLVRHHYGQPVVSLYLSLTRERTTGERKGLQSAFHSLRHETLEERRTYVDGLPRDERRQLETDLGEIELVLEEDRWAGASSLVILKAGNDLNRLVAVPVSVADLMVIDTDPYISPLERLLEAHPKVLVVEVAEDSARFWTTHMGVRRELGHLSDFVADSTVDAAHQRRRETHLHWHLRHTARVADHLLASEDSDRVVLVGEERVRALLEETLPVALAAKVLASLGPAGEPELAAEIERELARLKAEEEAKAVDALGPLRPRGRVAAGLEEVLEAVNRFAVQRLLIGDGASRPGFVCRSDHQFALKPGPCPYGGEDLQPVADLGDELAELAYVIGVDLLLFTQRPELLEPLGGVAAALYPGNRPEEVASPSAAARSG
jgi:release factor family 10